MNAWRWLGLSIFILAAVCFVGTTKYSAPDAFAKGPDDKKIEVKATPDKDTVEPGKSSAVALKLTRGKDATKDVTLTAVVAPADKKVIPKVDAKVAAKDTDAKLTVETATDTAEGDYKVTVTAKSEGSPDATSVFTLTVKKAAVVVPPVAGAKWEFKAFSKKFYVEQTTETTQDIKVMGQNVQQKQKQTFLIEWNPDAPAGADYKVKQKIIGVVMEINIGGNKISYDSRNPGKQKNPMTDFFDALVKQELTFTIGKDDLKVKTIDGRQNFVNNLSEINPQMKGLLNAILSDKSLSSMAEPTWYAFPPGGEKKKEWTRTSNLDLGPIGKYKTDFTFEPKETKGTKETIGIKTKLTYEAPTDKAGLPFIIHKATLTASDGTGTTVFDTATGRFDSTELKMKLTGTLEIEVGGMKTPVELSQDQTSTSKTYDDMPAEWKGK